MKMRKKSRESRVHERVEPGDREIERTRERERGRGIERKPYIKIETWEDR